MSNSSEDKLNTFIDEAEVVIKKMVEEVEKLIPVADTVLEVVEEADPSIGKNIETAKTVLNDAGTVASTITSTSEIKQ